MDKIFGYENEYICIKALQPGTQIIGLTRGSETKSHHPRRAAYFTESNYSQQPYAGWRRGTRMEDSN
ncbi:MAG: trp RNA-binding attenuation protein MtrB, partial [Clostridia bacterium]|nr:trp RNA-binding attenuation protein MtrB [Clostridia bacterium]